MYKKILINSCSCVYLMIKWIKKKRFSEISPSRWFEIEIKIKKLEIKLKKKKDDSKPYLDKILTYLFCNFASLLYSLKKKISELSEEAKAL